MSIAVDRDGAALEESALDRLARTLPHTLLASTDKDFTRGARRMHRNVALANAREICLDPFGWRVAIKLDVDRADGATAWATADLPEPNIVTVNPENGHAHYVYQLQHWVREDRPREVALYDAIANAMAVEIGADSHYVGKFTHNPFHAAYVPHEYESEPYDLKTLAKRMGVSRRVHIRVPSTHDDASRNCRLFFTTTRWAREQILERPTSFTDWHTAVFAFVDQHNTFEQPLPSNEVRSIARSVARYWWQRGGQALPPEEIAARAERKRVQERERKRRRRGSISREAYIERATSRRAAAIHLRKTMSVREIATQLQCSVREIYRLLQTPETNRNDTSRHTSERVVHGCPSHQDLYPARVRVDLTPESNRDVIARDNSPVRTHERNFSPKLPRVARSVVSLTDASTTPRARGANDEISSNAGEGSARGGVLRSWLDRVRERCAENALRDPASSPATAMPVESQRDGHEPDWLRAAREQCANYARETPQKTAAATPASDVRPQREPAALQVDDLSSVGDDTELVRCEQQQRVATIFVARRLEHGELQTATPPTLDVDPEQIRTPGGRRYLGDGTARHERSHNSCRLRCRAIDLRVKLLVANGQCACSVRHFDKRFEQLTCDRRETNSNLAVGQVFDSNSAERRSLKARQHAKGGQSFDATCNRSNGNTGEHSEIVRSRRDRSSSLGEFE